MPLYPGSSTFPGATTFPGGGDRPKIEVLYTTEDASEPTPSWQYVDPDDFYGYSVDRGRPEARSQHEAGTAKIALSNRARSYDPNTGAFLPMDRWWIRVKFQGVTSDRYKGYADSYQLTWPEAGMDSRTVVSCTDELKILNLVRLPSFDPATAGDYAAVVGADEPVGYWRWSDVLLLTTTIVDEVTTLETYHWYMRGWESGFEFDTLTKRTVTVEGQGWRIPSGGGYGIANDSAILGDFYGSGEDGSGGALTMASGSALDSTETQAGDMLQSTVGTVELWFKKAGNPIGTTAFWVSPEPAGTGGVRLWQWTLTNTGTVQFAARVAGGTSQTVTSPILGNNEWHHLVAVRDGTNLTLYVDGASYVAAGSTLAWEEASQTVLMRVAYPGATVTLDEMAVYPGKALSAARIAAHYSAGAARGYDQQVPGDRVGAVLDTIGSFAPRMIQAGTRTMYPAFMSGTQTLAALRAAEICEAPDGMFFCARDGTLTFLSADHRSNSPWNVTQATFDDDGSDLPYLDTEQVTDESSIANTWNAIKDRNNAAMQTASDAASISRYFEREVTISALPVKTNASALTIATDFLAKYKDALKRIPSITPDMNDVDVCAAVLGLELGDKVGVIRRPIGGGAAIQQTTWIQSWSESGAPGEPLRVSFGVSPV